MDELLLWQKNTSGGMPVVGLQDAPTIGVKLGRFEIGVLFRYGRIWMALIRF